MYGQYVWRKWVDRSKHLQPSEKHSGASVMALWMQKSSVRFWSTMQYKWKMSDWQQPHFSAWQWSYTHLASALKAYLHTVKHNQSWIVFAWTQRSTLITEHNSQHPKWSSEMFFKKPGEPFLKTACLCHLFLCMFSYFSIFLNLYHIIQAKNEEMSDGSKHLHSTVKK